MGIPKASSGFGVGWSGRSSLAKLGSAHIDGSVSSATFGGRLGRRQPMKQGSCFRRLCDRVSTPRSFTQMICWWTKAPAFSHASGIACRRDAGQR